MLAMEEYKNLLLLGFKFEKLKMDENAKKLYTRYVQLVGQVDYYNVLDFFYGYGASEYLTINTYDEAINKAMIMEKLKKLYRLISDYRIDWNNYEEVLPANNDVLMDFFRWVNNDQMISNDDLIIINNTISLLEKGVSFGISYQAGGTMLDVVNALAAKTIRADFHRSELK